MMAKKPWFIIVAFFLTAPGICLARTAAMSDRCANCHTMHNSQDSKTMGSAAYTTGNEALLINTCYGCHQGTNSEGSTPYVFDPTADYDTTGTESGASTRNTLAGGNFRWVSEGSNAQGHNVDGVAFFPSGPAPGNPTSTNYAPLQCAGSRGCHGNRSVINPTMSMYKTHHSNTPAATTGASLSESYRFLDGIAGIEDVDWELTVDNLNHNQYNAKDRINESDLDPTSINYLCANCHGDFHSGADNKGVTEGIFTNPWVRHPSDYDMGNSDISQYGPAGKNYSVVSPVASDLDVIGGTQSTILDGPADAIVMCLSCHRAHGSPYDANLRWDYKNWPAGGYDGCGECHTTKK
ncbi:MAG: hypothetical protein KKB30_08785 [Proteobacteria bacterium]|nr:hypothetical protein [Pseudomonadota bacterium]MBU1716882.1 hypothetical protein [Pseudomonadota bacterium]